MARRIYDTVLDRSMSQSDVQMLAGYISAGGVLDATELANDLMASIEFNTKYGGLSDLQFIERVSQNALGRTASLIELNTLLGQVSAGTITRAGIVKLIAESTEHLVVGNIHAITNNTESGNATARDHTTDKQVAGDIVQRLYDAALNRAATAAELCHRVAEDPVWFEGRGPGCSRHPGIAGVHPGLWHAEQCCLRQPDLRQCARTGAHVI